MHVYFWGVVLAKNSDGIIAITKEDHLGLQTSGVPKTLVDIEKEDGGAAFQTDLHECRSWK
jgi:hypothetical protein